MSNLGGALQTQNQDLDIMANFEKDFYQKHPNVSART